MRPSRQEAVFRRLLGEAVRNRAHWARVLPERRGGGGPHRSREEDGKRNQILAEGGAERLLARACRRPWGCGTTLPPVRVPSPTAPTLSPRGCPSATTTTRTSRKSSIRSILFNAQRTDCVMRWGSPSEKATDDYADSTKAPFLPGFAFLRRGRRCAFPEGCAHCASPWICSGASWVCSRFAKEVAPPFLAALSAMPLLSACGSGGGAKPGVPSSDVASRRSAGAKTPGDRRAIAGSQPEL